MQFVKDLTYQYLPPCHKKRATLPIPQCNFRNAFRLQDVTRYLQSYTRTVYEYCIVQVQYYEYSTLYSPVPEIEHVLHWSVFVLKGLSNVREL